MKQIICFILAALLISSLLSACMSPGAENSSLHSSVSESEASKLPSEKPSNEGTVSQTPSEKPSEKPSEAPSENSSESMVPSASPESEPLKEFESYIIRVKYVGSYIFSEPSYDGVPVQPMPIGSFTIVEEIYDNEGNLWGRLKSGVGYLCLTDLKTEAEPVFIGEAERDFLENGDYICYGNETDGALPLIIQSTEKLNKITLVTLEMFEDEFGAGDVLMHEPEMENGVFTVIWVAFPGDMSAFGISLTDSDNMLHRYVVSSSGRNGTIISYELD